MTVHRSLFTPAPRGHVSRVIAKRHFFLFTSKGRLDMAQRFRKRVKVLQHTQEGTDRVLLDFAKALQESRLRAAAGNPIPQTPITDEMMADPVNGEFWRQMFKARERVRLLRQSLEPVPEAGSSSPSP